MSDEPTCKETFVADVEQDGASWKVSFTPSTHARCRNRGAERIALLWVLNLIPSGARVVGLWRRHDYDSDRPCAPAGVNIQDISDTWVGAEEFNGSD